MKPEHGIQQSNSQEYFHTGDKVVGDYDPLGNKIKDGAVVGGEAANALTDMISTHAKRHGKTETVVKGKRGRKKKVQEKLEEIPAAKASSEGIKVSFRNDFGQISVNVVDAIYSDDDTAIALVFESKDAITFTPRTGEHLYLTVKGRTEKVFFPGTILPWVSGKYRIMVLYKEV